MARCESLATRQDMESIVSAGESPSTTATTTPPAEDFHMRYSHLHTSLGVKKVCARNIMVPNNLQYLQFVIHVCEYCLSPYEPTSSTNVLHFCGGQREPLGVAMSQPSHQQSGSCRGHIFLQRDTVSLHDCCSGNVHHSHWLFLESGEREGRGGREGAELISVTSRLKRNEGVKFL